MSGSTPAETMRVHKADSPMEQDTVRAGRASEIDRRELRQMYLAGGQGRTPEDLESDGAVVALVIYGAFMLVVGAALGAIIHGLVA